MAENSAISWTDHTFNPWIGCTRVSPACDGCYAAQLMGTDGGRFRRVVWGGPGKGEGTRERTAPSNWAKVRKWNRDAAAAPGRTFVFCASLADVFDNAVPAKWRRDLFDLIRETPNLTWLLLTKRPQLIERLYGEAHLDPPDGGSGYDWPQNAFAGTTVEDLERANRNVLALARAASQLGIPLIFLSCEPLLEGLDLFNLQPGPGRHYDAFAGVESVNGRAVNFWRPLGWIITGGETDQGAHKARVTDPAWKRSLRDQCAAAGVPYHDKQNGEWVSERELDGVGPALPNVTLPSGERMWRVGKGNDPCTLDGVKHDARPVIA